jgi:hypothetical protein
VQFSVFSFQFSEVSHAEPTEAAIFKEFDEVKGS